MQRKKLNKGKSTSPEPEYCKTRTIRGSKKLKGHLDKHAKVPKSKSKPQQISTANPFKSLNPLSKHEVLQKKELQIIAQ